MTTYINFNETITTFYSNESTPIFYSNESTPTLINESSLDDLCKNFHVSIFR